MNHSSTVPLSFVVKTLVKKIAGEGIIVHVCLESSIKVFFLTDLECGVECLRD